MSQKRQEPTICSECGAASFTPKQRYEIRKAERMVRRELSSHSSRDDADETFDRLATALELIADCMIAGRTKAQ